jgi:hypothetical protein
MTKLSSHCNWLLTRARNGPGMGLEWAWNGHGMGMEWMGHRVLYALLFELVEIISENLRPLRGRLALRPSNRGWGNIKRNSNLFTFFWKILNQLKRDLKESDSIGIKLICIDRSLNPPSSFARALQTAQAPCWLSSTFILLPSWSSLFPSWCHKTSLYISLYVIVCHSMWSCAIYIHLPHITGELLVLPGPLPSGRERPQSELHLSSSEWQPYDKSKDGCQVKTSESWKGIWNGIMLRLHEDLCKWRGLD